MDAWISAAIVLASGLFVAYVAATVERGEVPTLLRPLLWVHNTLKAALKAASLRIRERVGLT